jgi:hypothetical protein
MSNSNRDDFSMEVKRILGLRVNHLCSKPDCRVPTSGPTTDPTKAAIIGVAAHISAAAPGGKRYNPTISKSERSGILNGIWLCQNCAKLIDNDEVKYTTHILKEWKEKAEQLADENLGKRQVSIYSGGSRLFGFTPLSSDTDILQISKVAVEIEKLIHEIRLAWREGRIGEARDGFERIKDDRTLWPLSDAGTKSRLLEVEGLFAISNDNDIAKAKSLLIEATGFDTQNFCLKLRALIAYKEEGAESALSILDGIKDVEVQNLKSALLTELGRVDDSDTILENILQNVKTKRDLLAETYRLKAINALIKGNLSHASVFISKSKEIAPNWKYVKFIDAVIAYYGCLIESVEPPSLPPWPQPIDWSLVKVDDEHVHYLREASLVFKSLASQIGLNSEERKNYQAWYLASIANDHEKQSEARDYCRDRLSEDPTNYRYILWGLHRNFGIDTKTSIFLLEKLIRSEQVEISFIAALTECHLSNRNVQKASKLLQKNRNKFKTVGEKELWVSLNVRCLLQMKDRKKAIERLKQLRRLEDAKPLHDLIETAIISRNADWHVLLLKFQKEYEISQRPSFLLEACDLASYHGEWNFIAEHSEDLIEKIPTAYSVRLALISLYNSAEYSRCLSVLDKYTHLFSGKKLTQDLRRLKCIILHALGLLPIALAEAEKLSQEYPSLENYLTLAQIHLSMGNVKGVIIVAQRLLDHDDITLKDALVLCKAVASEEIDLARRLWKKAQSIGITEEYVGFALTLAFQLQLEEEANPLLEMMPRLSKGGFGGFQRASLDDMIDFIRSSNEDKMRINIMYEKGDIPIHFVSDRFRIPIVNWYHRLLEANITTKNPKHKYPLYVRYGGRELDSGFLRKQPKLRLNIDITSLLLSEHLGILDHIEKIFSPLRVSVELVQVLIEMKDELTHKQPSKLESYKKIITAYEAKNLRIATGPISHVAAYESLIDDMGKEWTSLFEEAQEKHGYVVDYLPLHRIDLKGLPNNINKEMYRSITDVRAIIDRLHESGPLSDVEFVKAINTTGTLGAITNSVVSPVLKSSLFFHGNIPVVLGSSNLIDIVCEHFEVYIQKSELERLRSELHEFEQTQEMLKWINGLLNKINFGINRGTYITIPFKEKFKENNKDIPLDHHVTRSLTTLMAFDAVDEDILWIDDRKMNSYPYRSGTPIVGINEILLELHEREVLSEEDLYNKIIMLRGCDAKFIPFQEGEILYHLNNANINDGKLIETKELGIIRQYIASCLLKKDILEIPSRSVSSPNPFGESSFVVGLGRAINNALVGVWGGARLELDSRIKSEWIFENVFIDHLGLFSITSMLSPNINMQYMFAVGLTSILVQGISLPIESKDSNKSGRKQFMDWIFNRYISAKLYADRNLVVSIVDVLKTNLNSILDKWEDRKQYIFSLQSFYTDLPDQIKTELNRDLEFMNRIGFSVRKTVTLEGIQFDAMEFYHAISETIHKREMPINSINQEVECVFRPYNDKIDKPHFLISCPSQHLNKIVTIEFPELFLDSSNEIKMALLLNRELFDCGAQQRKIVVAEIMSANTLIDRIIIAQQARKGNLSYQYSRIFQNALHRESFRFEDWLPKDPKSVLSYLRIGTEISLSESINLTLNNAAIALIEELDLKEAIIRNASLPIKLPEIIEEKIIILSEDSFRDLVITLNETMFSPISRMHLLRILSIRGNVGGEFERMAQEILESMISLTGALEFQAFGKILNWVDEELGRTVEFAILNPYQKLISVWTHGNNVFNIMMSTNVDLNWIINTFTFQKISYEAFERRAIHWGDIAHPRKLHLGSFILSGLSYVTEDQNKWFNSERLQSAISQLIFMPNGDNSAIDPKLILDRSLSYNTLDSFLSNDFSEWLNLFIGEKTRVIKPRITQQFVQDCIESIEENSNNLSPWLLLHVVLSDQPPSMAFRDKLYNLIATTNYKSIYFNQLVVGDYAILMATQQAINLDNEGLTKHLEEQLVGIAEIFESYSMIDQLKGYDLKEIEQTQNVLFEAAINIANCAPDVTARIKEFSRIIERLSISWPKLEERGKIFIERLNEELPTTLAVYLWPLIIRSRAN